MAFTLSVALLPIGLICMAILIFYPGSPIFKQQRLGINGNAFTIYKFRTLKKGGQPHSFGTFLRRYSLDEFPQLVNILKGDMSFIGPRPLLPEYWHHYSDQEKGRHKVKPGLSGLAQVSGGNSLSWQDQFQLDLLYVKDQSFTLDLQITLRTIGLVIKGREVEERKAFSSSKSSV